MISTSTLFGWVESYAAFGDHHTGTNADRATTDWLRRELEALGALVELEPFEFERYIVDSMLTGPDGVSVPSLPLFYSAVGNWDTADIEVVNAPLSAVGSATGIDAVLADQVDRGERPGAGALAIAIEGPIDLPVQCNRVPAVRPGRPAVVIAGNWAARVRLSSQLKFTARTEAASSANVVATFGSPDSPPVTVTTPLTGWTPAAGERGTGLAAALAVCAELQADHHVRFVACSGHELDHIGLRHHLDRRGVVGPTIHLGASVGAVEHTDDGTVLADTRMVLTTASGAARRDLREQVQAARWTLTDREPPWPGEGGTWVDAGASVLSFLGSFSLFHTAGDVTARATTPEAVQLATTTAIGAVRRFLADEAPRSSA